MGTLWPKNWKKLSFLLVTVPFLHIESSVIPPLKAFYEGLHFFFLHWRAMNNIGGHYDLKAWKFDDLTVLCAVWFTVSVLRDLFLKPWADQHLLTFKVNVKVKLVTHTWTLIRHIAARVSVLIQITVLDLEPDPCFQIFLNISETNYWIFNCNMSNRRSSQELPFIFFELRAATCLWGRYDPKTENFTLFLHISPLHPLLFKNNLRQFKGLPQGYISCSGC